MAYFTYLLFAVWWIAGVVLAKGFWMTLFAICIPFYSWYLVVELLMHKVGMI